MIPRVHVEARVQHAPGGEHVIHVRTNLDRVDACDIPAVFAALGAHVGFDAEELRKASTPKGGEGPDPRYPELVTLVQQARRDWDRFGKRLVREIERLLRDGKLLPMTSTNEALLLELFRDHQVAVLARFAGHTADLPRLRRLVDAGLVEPSVKQPSLIDLAFRLGRGLDMLHVHRVKPAEAVPLDRIVRDALRVELTDRDRQALAYVQRRGEVFMRRPVEQCTNAAQRALTLAELQAFRAATTNAIQKAHGHRELARALRDAASTVAAHPAADREAVREHGADAVSPAVQEAMANRTLQNDMERVARTELAFAHAHGAYEALRQQTAEAGIKDPEVYKFAAPRACNDCKRIWGPPANPTRYKLSYVEAREADGGNFDRPREDWGPVIGPVHPNCTEGPLQFYDRKLVDSINKAADEILAAYRK